jgi:photosystem II stability/assembly factor-like uncharacterized protein
MSLWRALPRVLGIWLGSSLLVALAWSLAVTLRGPSSVRLDFSTDVVLVIKTASGMPNWLDALLCCWWAITVGHWLDRLAVPLARRRLVAWLAAAVLLMTGLLILPWMLFPWGQPLTGRGVLPAVAELPYTLKPLIVVPYRLGQATPATHTLAAAALLGLGVVLTLMTLCLRIVWLRLPGEALSELRQPHARVFMLVALGSALVLAEYIILALASWQTPNWLDAIVAAALILVAGRWLRPHAATLAQFRVVRIAALMMLLLCVLALLPWLLLPSVGDGMWHTRQGEPVYLDPSRPVSLFDLLRTIAQTPYTLRYERLFIAGLYASGENTTSTAVRAVGLLVLAGLGVAALSLCVRIVGLALLDVPVAARLWEQTGRIWQHGRRPFARLGRASWLGWALVIALAASGGVLFTARPVQIVWRPVPSDGLPVSSPRAVFALASSRLGGSIFAGSDYGVYRSDDDGQTWQPASQGLSAASVRALAVGADGKRLFAGTANGIYRSDDDGQTWQPASQGLVGLVVQGLTLGPDRRTLFAVASSSAYRSDDGGDTWQRIKIQDATFDLRALVAGMDGQTIFGLTNIGAYRSVDNGRQWTRILAPPAPDQAWIPETLAVGPTDGALFVSLRSSSIVHSRDGGRHWLEIPFTDMGTVLAFTVAPDGRSLVAGTDTGIYRSDDDGQTWVLTTHGQNFQNVRSFAIGSDGKTIFAGIVDDRFPGGSGNTEPVSGGIARSDDGGRTWQFVHTSPTGLPIAALTRGPDGKSLFATTRAGIFRSEDNGQTWLPTNSLPSGPMRAAPAIGSDGRSLFAMVNNRVFRSEDGGRTWNPANEELDQSIPFEFAGTSASSGLFIKSTTAIYERFTVTSPSGEQTQAWLPIPLPSGVGAQFFAMMANDTSLFLVGENGLHYTKNHGLSWEHINTQLRSGLVLSLASTPEGIDLLAGTISGVYRSSDGGRTWTDASKGLEHVGSKHIDLEARGSYTISFDEVWGYGVVSRVEQQPGFSRSLPIPEGVARLAVWSLLYRSQGQVALAATIRGVYRSNDGGQNWQPSSAGLNGSRVTQLIEGPNGTSVFAKTDDGVYRSDDEGLTWRPVNHGLSSLRLRHIAVTPDSTDLYAATQHGIYHLEDDQSSWRRLAGDPGHEMIQTLDIGPDGRRLYVGTNDGLYQSDDRGETWSPIGLGSQHPFQSESLLVVPDTGLVLVGTNSGLFVSEDRGATWQPRTTRHSHYGTFAFSPDGQRLFVGGTPGGVSRSDDRGRTWRQVNQGLIDLIVPAVALAPDGQTILAQTNSNGIFRSIDGGQSWQQLPNSTDRPMATNAAVSPVLMAADEGIVGLYRPDAGWVRWATYDGAPPAALALRDGHAILYAFGSSGLMRTEAPLPLIWDAPTAMRAPLAALRRTGDWLGANAFALLVGPGLLALAGLVYAYAGIIRPNRLRPATALWLLGRPRHLLAAAGYRGYADRCAAGETLEQLVLLCSPADRSFEARQIEDDMQAAGAAVDSAGLQSTLAALVQRGLLIRDGVAYSRAEPLLAQILRREMRGDAIAWLAERTRQEHPLFAETRSFLTEAGFSIMPADSFGLRCASDRSLWADVAPLYVRLVLDRELDIGEFQALCAATRAVYGEDIRGRAAAVVIDRPPRAGDLYQIFALRAQEGLTIVPLPRSLILQARLDQRASEALREQVDLYTGRTDLYDVRAAVTDVLSFFGRGALLADLQRRLTSGRSALIIGVRKMGKSSLIGRLREEGGWPVALVDMQGYVGGLGYVYDEALRAWRTAAAVLFPSMTLPEAPANTATDLAAQAQRFRQAVDDMLDALARLPGRPGLLLFLDEIDVLADQAEYGSFAAVLRAVAENPRHSGRFAILGAGLDALLNRADRMAEMRNPLFSFFGETPLAPLDPGDARMMIVSIGGQMGIGYDEDALELLVEAGGGHPFLTRQLCSQAVRGLERPATVAAERAGQAIESYLRQARNYMAESLWGIDSGGPPEAEAALLQQFADEQPLAEALLLPPDLPLDAQRARRLALDHLHDQSLIRLVPAGWELTIPLYRRWIRRYILRVSEVERDVHLQ